MVIPSGAVVGTVAKAELAIRGAQLLNLFCDLNRLPVPEIIEPRQSWMRPWAFKTCAYYRPQYIVIEVDRCAAVGTVGRAWSYPGYVVDRTPYGVLQHELGHHVDYLKGPPRRGWRGTFSVAVRANAQEPALTGYAPDDTEWFAEMFRLFVTNPDLLAWLRPKTYWEIAWVGFQPCELRSWRDVLAAAPPRTIAACVRRLGTAA